MSVLGYVHMSAGTQEGQKRSFEAEIEAVVICLS